MTTTATSIFCDPTKRHDFVFLFDVTNGNPNGDPDAGNLPRIDPETMHGLVTDVCIKRKIRDWVDMTHSGEDRYEIYIQNNGIALNEMNKRAHMAVFETKSAGNGHNEQAGTEARRSKGAKDDESKESASSRQNVRREWMCNHFYDIRTFGAVLSTGDYPAGQVRGPIQLTFAQSISPNTPLDISITRVAVTEIDEKKKTTTTMGRKSFVPYGLYRGHGFFVPHFAQQTGFSAEDLDLFWTALRSIWDVDRSASRGMLALRGLYIFSHDNALGNAPAHSLFDRIHIDLDPEAKAPRHFGDYTVTVDEADLPEGVTLNRLV